MRVLVTGGKGFVASALIPALIERGVRVRATTRGPLPGPSRVEWLRCDIGRREELEQALSDIEVAYFLVHGMGGGRHDYAQEEARTAELFREVAAERGVKRIIYLGGVAPAANPSMHLQSRLQVGEVLRAGPVPTLELRASMIIGPGSVSWQIVRDLAMRLPVMVLPAWTRSITCPVAIEDVVTALVGGLHLPLPSSAWFDIPGPDSLSGSELLMRIALLQGRRVPTVPVPLLSVSLSSWWLRLVTRADFSLARELVLGFTSDLIPQDDRYWGLIDAPPRVPFDRAARNTLARERPRPGFRGLLGGLEEALVGALGRSLARR